MNDDMKNTIKQNVMYNTLYQVLILLIPFILTPYLTRTLGRTGHVFLLLFLNLLFYHDRYAGTSELWEQKYRQGQQ